MSEKSVNYNIKELVSTNTTFYKNYVSELPTNISYRNIPHGASSTAASSSTRKNILVELLPKGIISPFIFLNYFIASKIMICLKVRLKSYVYSI